jgi:hypothetical protein
MWYTLPKIIVRQNSEVPNILDHNCDDRNKVCRCQYSTIRSLCVILLVDIMFVYVFFSCTSVLQNNNWAMTGNLDSKIISIDSYLQVEMVGKCSTVMYLFPCTTSMTIVSIWEVKVSKLNALIPTIFAIFSHWRRDEFFLKLAVPSGRTASFRIKNIENWLSSNSRKFYVAPIVLTGKRHKDCRTLMR